MEFSASWQSVVAAASCQGETSFSRPTHFTHIASNSPTLRSLWWRLLLNIFPHDPTQVSD